MVDQDGHPVALDKGGHLQRMFARTDPALTEDVLDSLEQVLHDLREVCGLDAFLAFGCLLGAVRDGHVIGHDCDADVSYLSRHTHPFDVIRENKRAADTMESLGWRITRMSAGDFKIWTRPGGGRRVGIDVFAAFHVDGTFYMVPSVTGELARSALLPVGEVTLEGRRFVAPAWPEALLEATYGPSWQVPDPSFEFDPSRATLRRLNGWLRNNRKHLRQWNDFYRSRSSDRVPTTPTPFAAWVSDRLELRQHVLDVGCGNGRDSVHFAEQGHRVTALDGTQQARRHTRRLAAQHCVDVRLRELNLNDLHSTLVSGARFAHRKRPPQIYARFLLDAVEEDTRDNFFRWAQMIQRRGGLTFLEFRTWRGALRAKALPFRYRSLLAPDRVVAEIERYGGSVVHREEGRAGTLREREPTHLSTRSEVDVNRSERDRVRKQLGPWSLYRRVVALEKEIQESRRLNQRLSDVVDVITEVLVPAVDRDDERMRTALSHLQVVANPPAAEAARD